MVVLINFIGNSVLDDCGYIKKCISTKSILKIESKNKILTL